MVLNLTAIAPFRSKRACALSANPTTFNLWAGSPQGTPMVRNKHMPACRFDKDIIHSN